MAVSEEKMNRNWHIRITTNTAWTLTLPAPPYSTAFSSPQWGNPVALDTYLHHDASSEMLSVAVGDHRHHATYDDKGFIITEGVRAGRPHKYDYAAHAGLHQQEDLEPFIRALQLDGNPCLPIGMTDLSRPMMSASVSPQNQADGLFPAAPETGKTSRIHCKCGPA
jgi:hypothetical protein